MLYVISYDIPDDGRRNHVADILKDFGHRVQYSVFEALLDGELPKRMRERILAIVRPDEDSIRVYCLCNECNGKIEIIGLGSRTIKEKVYVV